MHVTYSKGETAVLKVQLKAIEKDIIVSKPAVEARYDLIFDDNGELYRVQVKYCGRIIGGAVQIDLNNQTRNNSNRRAYTREETDFILAYVPEKEVILKLPAELFDGKPYINLRFEPSKNGQVKGIHYAKDYIW